MADNPDDVSPPARPSTNVMAAAVSELEILVNDPDATNDRRNLERQIVLCRYLLTVMPRQKNGMLWGELNDGLGTALAMLGAITGDEVTLRAAETAYRDALLERTRARSPMDWASTQHNLGTVLRSLGDLTGDAALLRAAETAYRGALLGRTRARAPMDWASTRNNLGIVLERLGDSTGDVAFLHAAEDAYRDALLERTRKRVPMDWAMTQNSLGNVLQSLGKLAGDAALLREAETAFRNALLERTRARAPMDWAMTQNNLGIVLRCLGDLTGDAVVLRAAETAYREALLERTRARAPMDWGLTSNNIGCVLHSLGTLTGDASVLRSAETAYRDALLECTRTRAPMNWAMTQNNLGNLLEALGDLTGDAVVLRAAETAYREALLERTRARAPMDWAGTQHNLSNVLRSLGNRTGDAAVLRSAVQACRDALLERTRERAPMDWATTQSNLGNVLGCLGELTGDIAMLRQAEAAYRSAMDIRVRERVPMEWARVQNNLSIVLWRLGDLTGDAAVLRAAETACRDALLELTRERAPMAWATAKNNLGNVLLRLSDLTSDATVLRSAEAACRDALLERTRARAPMDWAMTQANLGNVLLQLGDLTSDATALRAAETAFRDALLELTRKRSPMYWANTQGNLGNVLRILSDLTGDATTLHAAESAYRDALLELDRARTPMEWARSQNNLGGTLRRLGDLTGDAAALRAAEAAYRDAIEAYEGGAEDNQQGTAGALAHLLARSGRYDESASVIEPTLARSGLAFLDAARSRDGVAQAVAQVGDLYALLSLCRLRQARPDTAAALIAAERGRARLLANTLALNAVRPQDLNNPEVRASLEAARDRRTALRVQLGYERLPEAAATAQSPSPAERERLQAELRQAGDAYVALCRAHGLIRPIEPLGLDQIMAAAPPGGALILPVLTDSTALAFVVLPGASEPAALELPHLSRRAVTEHLSGEDNWLGLYQTHFLIHRGRDRQAAAHWHHQLTATMAWLWDQLIGPLHQHLRDVARLARNAPVVLLPPGMLGLLPLHAAGPGPDGRYFCDHWTVSYAPGVRSLLTCQSRRDERVSQPARLLAAIDADGSLSGARAEGPMLRQGFAAPGREPVILTGEEATIARVVVALPDATLFHASTHGMHDPVEPARSGLLLADGVLQLDMLRDARLDAMRLVFLFACESGLAGVRKLPEEFIGLPTGFVEAGAAAVVGSLWPIGDTSALLLARRFYDLMFDYAGQERMAPATALRTACAWLRDVTFGELREEFPLANLPSGPALVLRSARMVPGALEPDRPTPPEDPHLPLGPDDERPFAHPTHWAAFTCMGC